MADGTDVVGRSPVARAATWLLMVMPLFFAVGGYVHLRTLGPAQRPAAAAFVLARAERLLGPVAVLLGAWLVTAAVLGATGGPVDVAVDRTTTPLWFVAVYLVVVLLAPLTVRLHHRHGLCAAAGGAVVVAVLDALRATGPAWRQPWAETPSLLAVWLVVHQLGHLWGDGRLDRRHDRALLAAGGWGSALLLTVGTGGWYPVDMQGLPGSDASNFAPPTLALLAQGAGLLATVLLLREPAGRLPALVPLVRAARPAKRRRVLPAGSTAPRVTAPRSATRVVPAVIGTLLVAVGTYAVSQLGVDGWVHGTTEPLLGASMPVWPALATLAVGVLVLSAAARREA